MDPRERADAALARARARGAFVVTPDDAVSPMDAANTVQIPRSVVNAADGNNPDSTMVIPGLGRGQTQQQGYPPQRGHQTGPHQPVPYPGHQQGNQQGGQLGGQQAGQYQDTQHQSGVLQSGHQSGQHQPVPYPGNQYQSGQHQPVPPPPGHGRQEQAPQQRNPLFEEQEPTPRQLDGLVPTTQHPGTQRGTLSRRLDGQ